MRFRSVTSAPQAPSEDQIAYVLGTLSDDERRVADEVVERVAESVVSVLTVGVERTMNRFN